MFSHDTHADDDGGSDLTFVKSFRDFVKSYARVAEEEGLPAPRHVPVVACCCANDAAGAADATGAGAATAGNMEGLRQVSTLITTSTLTSTLTLTPTPTLILQLPPHPHTNNYPYPNAEINTNDNTNIYPYSDTTNLILSRPFLLSTPLDPRVLMIISQTLQQSSTL